MFSFPSWQTFPSVSLPQNIQRRFVSYFLRKALGHLVKPGQLDPNQIDAQIGSGIVQVTDVEFNHDALNEKLYLAQLPFVLEAGSLGRITANLPWPNLLTAPVALSMSSLDITLIYSPISRPPDSAGLSVEGISESVNHMAESFVHEELDSTGISKLQSTSKDTLYTPPGSFEHTDIATISNDGELATQGVSLIATLIEKLLSRFKFDISDIHIRVVFPEKMTLIFHLERIAYMTEDAMSQTVDEGQTDKGEVRTLSFGSISVSMKTSSSDTLSESSVSSDDDHESMAMMSQSLAALPPQDRSTSALGTSLYHSVLSTLQEEEKAPPSTHTQTDEEHRLLSLGHGTESIVATLTTPSLRAHTDIASSVKPRVSLNISISPLLITLNPVQVAVLLHILSLFDKPDSPTSAGSKSSGMTMFDDWTINVNLRELCFILSNPLTMSTEQRIIDDFHLQYPTSRELRVTHLRISFDCLCMQLKSLVPSTPGFHGHQANFQGHLDDMCILLFSSDSDRTLLVSPVLIGDPDLNYQYDRSDDHLPVLDIHKWARNSEISKASKASFWRTHSSQTKQNKPPVLCIQAQTSQRVAIEMDVIPMHVYIDIGTIQFVSSYMDGITNIKQTISETTGQHTPSHTKQVASSVHLDEHGETRTGFTTRFSFIRVEVSMSPFLPSSSNKSGILVLDLHQFRISQEGHVDQSSSKFPVTVLGTLQFNQAVIALALPNHVKATAFLSVSSVTSSEESSALPSVCLRTISSTGTPPSGSFSVDIAFPFLNVSLSKALLEGLVYWLDDLSKWNATTSNIPPSDSAPNVVSSKHFLRRKSSRDSGSTEHEEGSVRKPEFVVKLSIDEGKINLLVPRSKENGQHQPLAIILINTEILMEISPEGKNETVITMGIESIDITDRPEQEKCVPILHPTHPHVKHATRPLAKLRYVAMTGGVAAHKSSKVKLSFSGFTFHLSSDTTLLEDLQSYSKSPEGVFETVVPNERTAISVAIVDGSFEISGQGTLGSTIVYIGELDFGTVLINASPEVNLKAQVLSSAVLFVDNKQTLPPISTNILNSGAPGISLWKTRGYALFADISNGEVQALLISLPFTRTELYISNVKLQLLACADTLSAFSAFTSSVMNELSPDIEEVFKPSPIRIDSSQSENLLASLDEEAFSRLSGLGPTADMINDDLPTNPDYLDVSYGAAGGFRELEEADLLDFEESSPPNIDGVISTFGGETIRMIDSRGIKIIENYFENIVPEPMDADIWSERSKMRIRADNCDVTFSLYEGYDWLSTRRLIEEQIKLMRRRLVKIKQLLAEGQIPDCSIEDTSTVLFNSVSIGLPDDPDDMEPPALIAAIDRELQDEDNVSESSWQSFTPPPNNPSPLTRLHGSKLDRSRKPVIDFCFKGIRAEVDTFEPTHDLLSKVLVAIKDVEILDHLRTSTWKKFLTELRVDFQGNVRQTDSDMVRGELRLIRSVPNPQVASKEGRFRLKILPIKLNVDQDALDFMKKFFSFQPSPSTDEVSQAQGELYFQHVEVFPVDLKLDYKPKRVDYRALRQGKTIELMNFFHFDGSEITLRHITLSGITGWGRLSETLNDLWTPDVKANQLADIISGVSPIRSVVNVGSGVADLVLLPIAQYKKDKRLVRGVQKGTAAFMKNTAMEAVKLGARLATGTQVILEQAETVLGGQGQFRHAVTTEALQHPDETDDDREMAELISKYADQPQDVQEGFHIAYRSLSRNLHSAAQTILAVPMEVYEKSGNEGAVRAIVRAVPIAVLKPMIGASEAVSKTLFGLRNTLDPGVRHDNEAKYKHR